MTGTMTRGDRLKQVRDQLEWSQEELATHAGLPAHKRDWFAKMEKGKNQISGEDAQSALARAFNTNVPALLKVLDGETSVATFVEMVRAGAMGETPRPATPARGIPSLGVEPSERRYMNLDAALAQASEQGKTFEEEVVRAARALVFRLGYDPMPDRWLQILGHQKRTLEDLRAGREIGVPVTDAEVAKPTFKAKRK